MKMSTELMEKITRLERRIKEQDSELKKLNKKSRKASFWLFWLLSKEEV